MFKCFIEVQCLFIKSLFQKISKVWRNLEKPGEVDFRVSFKSRIFVWVCIAAWKFCHGWERTWQEVVAEASLSFVFGFELSVI